MKTRVVPIVRDKSLPEFNVQNNPLAADSIQQDNEEQVQNQNLLNADGVSQTSVTQPNKHAKAKKPSKNERLSLMENKGKENAERILRMEDNINSILQILTGNQRKASLEGVSKEIDKKTPEPELLEEVEEDENDSGSDWSQEEDEEEPLREETLKETESSKIKDEPVKDVDKTKKYKGEKEKSKYKHKFKKSKELDFHNIVVQRPVNLKPYNGEDNPEQFIKLFETYCTRMRIPEREKLSEFRDNLIFRVQNWFDRNNDDFENNYLICKQKFLSQYHKSKEQHEARLFVTQQKQEEDLRSFLKRLENIARPAALEEYKIRQSFLMNIWDRSLKEFARMQFILLNTEQPLEKILPILEEKEISIKYTKQRANMQTNRRPETRGPPPKPGFKQNYKPANKVNVVEEETSDQLEQQVHNIQQEDEIASIDERVQSETEEDNENIYILEVSEVSQDIQVNSRLLENQRPQPIFKQGVIPQTLQRDLYVSANQFLPNKNQDGKPKGLTKIYHRNKMYQKFLAKNFLPSLFESECIFEFTNTDVDKAQQLSLLKYSWQQTQDIDSNTRLLQQRINYSLYQPFEKNKLLTRKYTRTTWSKLQNRQYQKVKQYIATYVLLKLLEPFAKFIYLVKTNLSTSTINGYATLDVISIIYLQQVMSVVEFYTANLNSTGKQLSKRHQKLIVYKQQTMEFLLSGVYIAKYICPIQLQSTLYYPALQDQKIHRLAINANIQQVSDTEASPQQSPQKPIRNAKRRINRLTKQRRLLFIFMMYLIQISSYLCGSFAFTLAYLQKQFKHLEHNLSKLVQSYKQVLDRDVIDLTMEPDIVLTPKPDIPPDIISIDTDTTHISISSTSTKELVVQPDTQQNTNTRLPLPTDTEIDNLQHYFETFEINVLEEKPSTRKTPYIPDQTPEQYAKTHIPQMSLHQVLLNSHNYQAEWQQYIMSLDNDNKSQVNNVVSTQQYTLSDNVALKYIDINIQGIPVKAMVDTGCSRIVASRAFVEKHQLQNKLIDQKRFVTTAESSGLQMRQIWPNVNLSLQTNFQDLQMVTDILIMNSFSNYDVILGQSFLNFFNYQMSSDSLFLKHPSTKEIVEIKYADNNVLKVEENYDFPPPISVLIASTQQLTEQQLKLYPNFPIDKRDIFLIDPPWSYVPNDKGIRLPPHPTLNLQELQLLPVPLISKPNGILLLWTTSPMMKQALNLITTYGFYFKTVLFVWVKLDNNMKPQRGKGAYTDPCCEYLLIATKGQYQKFLKKDQPISQLLQTKNLKDSRKPIIQYSKLDRLFDLKNLNCLEIFSRKPPGSEEFSHYGNEIPNYYFQTLKLSKDQINLLDDLENFDTQTSFKPGGSTNEGPFETEPFSQIFITQEELQNSYVPESLKTFEETLSEIKIHSKNFLPLVREYRDIFSRGDSDIGTTNLVEHEIKLIPGAQPKIQRPYKMGRLEINAINQIVDDTLKIGVIKEEASPFLHPVVLVKKPNGKYRMCINFKYLNSLTLDDKFPIPLISFILQSLSKAKIFSKLDAKSGFWQIRMALNSIKYTGFVTTEGQYVYLRMPFGLKNAPATYQRLMNLIFKDFINKFIIVYIDDIIIYSETPEQHLEHLRLVFERLRQVNIKLGGDKCVIGSLEIDILGHTIREGEILPQKEKVAAIQNIKESTNKTELRAFLGLSGYYRQYVPNYAQVAFPLYPLIGNQVEWLWGPAHKEAMQKIKDAIASNAVLGMLQNDQPLILYTDFSIIGIGAILAQKVSERKEKVVEFASRTLNKYEKHLDSYCGEVLAVYWAIQKFRQYILSVPFPLTIITDNKALEWVLKLGTTSPIRKIQRWTIEIDQYSYQVKHRKGDTHLNADALSRLIGELPEELNKEKEQILSKDSHTQILHMEDVGDIACKTCNSTHEENPMLICDRCGDAFHQECASVRDIPDGLWYCQICTSIIDQNKEKDIIYNRNLYDYLQRVENNSIHRSQDQDHVLNLQKSLPRGLSLSNFLIQNQRLYYKDQKGKILLIPSIVERDIIIKEQHHLSGHSGISRTKDKILQQYWWEHLHDDVVRFLKTCEICNVTSPTFSQQPSLHTTSKGMFPFQILAADLITNLQDISGLAREEDLPVTDEDVIKHHTRSKRQTQISKDLEYKHCIVVIDVFSKYVELGALKSKSSEEIAQWFNATILCRHGTPYVLRTDQGTEFLGALDQLCQDHSIETRKISSHYPQANGQAERTVQTVTRILRRFLLSKHYTHLRWWEVLPFVQRAINTSSSSATLLSPHEVLYGQKMYITDSVNYTLKDFQENFPDIEESTLKEYVKNLQDCLISLQNRVKINLQRQDKRMQEQYEKRPHTELQFQKGQRVYLQKLRTNKLEPRVLGPFIFQKYNPNRITAEVTNPDNGHTRTFNTNTLSPASLIQVIYY